jgi:hypothetical protein
LCAGFSENIGASGLTTEKYSGPSSVSSFGMIGGESSGGLGVPVPRDGKTIWDF